MDPIADLYRQVYEHPDDDHVRRVLADALLAIGDPRGELITAQLDTTGAHATQAMRLIQRNGLTWLGSLRGKVVPLAYERGFLASCVAVDPAAVAGVHEWATVHSVELSEEGHQRELEFLAHGVMRSLRRVTEVAPARWASLPSLPRLVELGVSTWRALDSWLASEARRWPNLERVTAGHPSPFELARGADARFSRLRLRYRPEIVEWLHRLPVDALTELVVTAAAPTGRRPEVPRVRVDELQAAAARQVRLARLELEPASDRT